MQPKRFLIPLLLGLLLVTQAACHTTQLGRSIGFPSP